MHFNSEFWSWPQYAVLGAFLTGIVINAIFHGEPKLDSDEKPYKFNVVIAVIKTAIWIAVLNAGGFFG